MGNPAITVPMRDSVATASTANNIPSARPSRPVRPAATAAVKPHISMLPHAPPVTTCAAISISSEPAFAATSAANAPSTADTAITCNVP